MLLLFGPTSTSSLARRLSDWWFCASSPAVDVPGSPHRRHRRLPSMAQRDRSMSRIHGAGTRDLSAGTTFEMGSLHCKTREKSCRCTRQARNLRSVGALGDEASSKYHHQLGEKCADCSCYFNRPSKLCSPALILRGMRLAAPTLFVHGYPSVNPLKATIALQAFQVAKSSGKTLDFFRSEAKLLSSCLAFLRGRSLAAIIAIVTAQ